MNIASFVKEKKITEILHFTTHLGLIGILDSKLLKPRSRLSLDNRLEHILKLNTPKVMDPDWEHCLNLSISRINFSLFNISSNKWHQDVSWRILSFSSKILSHDDVTFTTTNNIYTGVKRGKGLQGLIKLYEPSVVRWQNNNVIRPPESIPSFPTCEQAEVIYPNDLPTTFLNKIYVASEDDLMDVEALFGFLGHEAVEVIVDPSKFGIKKG